VTGGSGILWNSGTALLKKSMNFCAGPSPSGWRRSGVGGGVNAESSVLVCCVTKFGE
jgi:hypothetical protein